MDLELYMFSVINLIYGSCIAMKSFAFCLQLHTRVISTLRKPKPRALPLPVDLVSSISAFRTAS
jgi:hypothetical protein